MRHRLTILSVLLLVGALIVPDGVAAPPQRRAPRAASATLSKYLQPFAGRIAQLGQVQTVTAEGVVIHFGRATYDYEVLGGGMYRTDWLAAEFNGNEFGAFELRESMEGDRQIHFYDFELNDTLIVNDRLTRARLNTGEQLGDFGMVRIDRIPTLSEAVKRVTTRCRTLTRRRGFMRGRMGMDPTGRGQPVNRRGRYAIDIFRETQRFGDGCPPPPPTRCFDYEGDATDAETGTRLFLQYGSGNDTLNVTSTNTSRQEPATVTHEAHANNVGTTDRSVFTWDDPPGTFMVDLDSPYFEGDITGTFGSPTQGSDECGQFNSYPLMPHPSTRFGPLTDFVEPNDRATFTSSDSWRMIEWPPPPPPPP